ncbi:unnamed protein product [Prunus armeniaca]
MREFFYFFQVKHYEIMYGTMMCWKSADGGKAMLVMVHLFPSPTATAIAPAHDVKRWKQNGPYPNDLPTGQEKKKPKLPSTEKTQVGVVSPSPARVKYLVGVDSKKIGCMRNIRNVPLKTHADKFRDRDLLKGKNMLIFLFEVRVICTRQRMEIELGAVESRAVMRGVDLSSLTLLEVRLDATKKARESSA